MKKRIITLLAVLALLVTCAVFAVQAETEVETCPCCGVALSEIEWSTAVPYGQVKTGHYKRTGHTGPGQGVVVGEGETVVLFLDGSASTTGPIYFGKYNTKTTTDGKDLNFRTIAVQNGGKLYVVGKNAVVTGAAVDAGTDSNSYQNGGIAYVGPDSELHLSGDLTVEVNSLATNVPRSGGVIFNAGTVTMDGVTVNGYKAYNGGAIYSGGTLEITNSTINGGTAEYRGGAIYKSGGALTVESSTIYGGAIGNRAGALYNGAGKTVVTDSKVFAFNGGEADTGNKYRGIVVAGGELHLNGKTVISSSAKGTGDGIAMTAGIVTLSDEATVKNVEGTFLRNIWIWKNDGTTGKLRIDDNWTGTASVTPGSVDVTNHGSAVASKALFYGNVDPETFAFTAGTSTTAKVTGLRLENASHEFPQLAGYQAMMPTCRAQLIVDGKTDSWHVLPSGAVTAYGKINSADKYIKLWATNAATISSDVVVDVNGRAVSAWTVNEGATLYAFDSTAKAGAAGKTVATAGAGTLAPLFKAPTGKIYATNAGVIYPVEAAVTHVTLRPGTEMASMYYTATFNVAAEAGLTGGVAMTVDANAGTESLENYVYTNAAVAAGEANGVLLEDIVHNGRETNKAYAAQTVYAKAYVQVGDTVVFADGVAGFSLISLIEAVEAQAPDNAYVKAMVDYDWYKSLKA